MKSIVLFFLFFLVNTQIILPMENDSNKNPIFEKWHDLPEDMRFEIITNFIKDLIKSSKSFNILNSEILKLRANKEINSLLKKFLTDKFIINLANDFNLTSDYPISYYQLAKALLLKSQFDEFAKRHKIKADSLGEKLLNLIGLENLGVNADYLSISENFIIEAKELIKDGANLDYLDAEGQTLLIGFILFGNKELVKLLIQGGANLKLKNKDEKTPLEVIDYEIDHLIDKQDNPEYLIAIQQMIKDALHEG